jgi:uncharacterized protein (DUF1800 family)
MNALNRRSLVKAGAALFAGMIAPAIARAQGIRRQGIPTGPPPRMPQGIPPQIAPAPSIDPSSAWISPELRLARRVSFGVNPTEAARAKSLGYAQYLEYQLAPELIDDTPVNTFVATNFPTVAEDLNTLFAADSTTVQNQLTYATIYSSAFSSRQLYERLVEFWSDHFNISMEKVGYLKVIDDNTVIRQYAMTTFPQLLKASAHSPAMLLYLDQTMSTKGAPNQNYAREIMELHTLGVDGGYTQTDVAELSRVLTGWTIAGKGTFSFNSSQHDFGSKTVLGVTIPAANPITGAAAQAEGEGMLNVLAVHPSTATFISTKMLQYFLRYDPSPAQITAVAQIYASTGGDIKSMLREVLSEANVTASPAKFKRPYHLIMAGLRALGPSVTAAGVTSLLGQVATVGQQPFTWLTPDGFPDSVEYWSGNMLTRWNYATFLSNANTATTVQFNVTPFMTPATAVAIVAAINTALFAGEMPPRLASELTTYVSASPTNAATVRETIGLALSSSAFQYY